MANSPWGANIDMNQFTANVVKNDTDHTVSGTGIFDVLMNTATKHITAQLDAGRIRGEDYATSYTELFQACLAAAVRIWTTKPLADLQEKSEEAKTRLYYRQIEGFDEDYKQKIFKIMLDGYSVLLSVQPPGVGATIPTPITANTITSFYTSYIVPDIDLGNSTATNTRASSIITEPA